ncbi:UbiA prenyltransferase [Roridomyces roridus]|uniref:UbiA prenyltransferase n=1 Tax=Roridomyces roridus TaxID=1738132 RepID=A0AAD7FE20_9AGAR|nr:UbiA prenyltransferase [Roridomyces roridus]
MNLVEKRTALFALPTRQEVQACWELCRLHNNIGFWVVWLPTAWSIAMVYHAQPEIRATDALLRALVYVPLCFGIKSLIMTIDDILDHDIDALVMRTRERALPRGAISLARAWMFFGIQVLLGVYLASRTLSKAALYVSMPVWPLYVIYPTCKRWTNLAPIPLGLMFKIGIFMGWSDLSISPIPFKILTPIYIGACLWTVTYETIYQHQDHADDIRIGLRSPARLCGKHTIKICTGTGIGFLGLLSYGGALNGHGWAFQIGVLGAGIVLLSGLAKTNIDSPETCKAMFLGTPLVGQIVLAGFVVDAVLHRGMEGIPF